MENRTNSRSKGAAAPTVSIDRSVSERQPVASTGRGGASGSQEGTPTSVQHSAVGPSHGLLGIGRVVPVPDVLIAERASKRPRKERRPNWELNEVHALIEAKRILQMEETDSADGRDLMIPDHNKWLRISKDVMLARVSTNKRDAAACKSKWNLLVPEYKRIVDFLSRTGTNDAMYWTMTAQEKKKEGLPSSFSQDIYNRIHEFHRTRPSVKPPHARDLLSADDRNFQSTVPGPHAVHGGDCSADIDEESQDPNVGMGDSDEVSASLQSGSAAAGKRPIIGLPRLSPSTPASNAPKSFIPAGVCPQLLSSSDTADATAHRRSGSTGVRRKNHSGHSLIAEATRATGEAMSGQMKAMAEASRELERSKMEVQMKIFSEQMDYQRERDRRLQDTARQANENAKLSIEKQADVVQCLAQLASVLSTGLRTRDSPTCSMYVPRASPEDAGPSHGDRTGGLPPPINDNDKQ